MTLDDTRWLVHARRLITATVCAGALVAAGGGVASATTLPGDTPPATAPLRPNRWGAVTLTETGIEGMPDDLVAGVVDVTVTDETEGAGGAFDHVGRAGHRSGDVRGRPLQPVPGRAVPRLLPQQRRRVGQTVTALDAGEYIAWMDLAANLDRESTVEDIIAVPMTVGESNNDAVIPATDGSIRGGDYLFDVDVTAGGSMARFTNSSDNQFHHVRADGLRQERRSARGGEPAGVDRQRRRGRSAPRASIRRRSTSRSPVFTGVRTGGEWHLPGDLRGGAPCAALCFISGPRGRPAARDPARDVRRLPGRCRRLTIPDGSAGGRRYGPGRDVPVPAAPALDPLHPRRRRGDRGDDQPRVLAVAPPRRTPGVNAAVEDRDRPNRRSPLAELVPAGAEVGDDRARETSSGGRSRRPVATSATRRSTSSTGRRAAAPATTS